MSATADDFGPEQFADASSRDKVAEALAGAFDKLRQSLEPLVNAVSFIRAAEKAKRVTGESNETHKDGVTTQTHAVIVTFATEADALAFAGVMAVFAPRPTFEQMCSFLGVDFSQIDQQEGGK